MNITTEDKNKAVSVLRKMVEENDPGNVLLYLVIRGSHSYGTNTETSDVDYAGVFVQPVNSLLGLGESKLIMDAKSDITIFEVGNFVSLLAKNNPTVLELLNTPDDCILYKHPVMDILLENKHKFLSKQCSNALAGYAKQQMGKAKGQDKKQNWEKDRVVRKTPIDFCYAHLFEKSVPLVQLMEERGKMQQEKCGLSRIPHARELFALYYDCSDSGRMGFRGIAFEDSNDIRLSSIPPDMDELFIAHVSYNKDAYSQHCKDFNEYQEWLQNRNEARWVEVKGHDQKIDGKNMMHCMRLIQMGREVALGQGINVRRDNASELLAIRRGEVDLASLLSSAEAELKKVDELFAASDLPDKVDQKMANDMVIEIRNKIYFTI